jgi:hypothetical protein
MYLLMNAGGDAIANDAASRPDGFWKGFDVNLGAALGKRYRAAGVWRRDFAGGVALVNEPGAGTRTVSVGPGFHDIDGAARSSVTLGPASGAVLLRDGARPAQVPAAPTPPARTLTRTVAMRPRVSGGHVHGSVRGASGGVVRIVVERRRSGRWATVRRARAVVGTAGGYSRAVARLTGGRYRVRARYLGTPTASPSRSGYHRFRVRP